jgi:hypothetical protein
MNSNNNQPLAKSLRTQLENTVKTAREVAEKGAHAALSQIAVGEAKAPDYLTEELKALRRRLRAHGRALGDTFLPSPSGRGARGEGIRHLIWEVAYEHWHRMLFARFLAENGLLLWEPGAPVSLDDCRDMVDNHPDMAMGAKSHWELAGKLAARMLPQVFKPQSPVFELTFAPEHQRELERLLAALPSEVFQASDSLGWVYQFWQAKRKQEVNDSEIKIGADELPAVTQLFTEPYMVDFLLHNSLGAWWVTRHPGKTCPVPLTYLRTLDDGTPAAGKFEGWPDRLEHFKLLDPCCGSGHFLVAAFLLLVPMRMDAEGLSAIDAVDAVLADNLHGLELDARCVEIAVFALALAAWRFPDENGDPLGVRADMPAPQIACCGLKVAAKPEDWMALVPDDWPNAAFVQQELRLLHVSFAQAPLLGSLLAPARVLKNDLATSSFDTLRKLLERALSTECPATLRGQASELQDDSWDLALTAKGLLDAARLLDTLYHLVVTNVPYRSGLDLSDELRSHIEREYSAGKSNLASAFLLRCEELVAKKSGHMVLVLPQDWLVQPTYEKLRKHISSGSEIKLIARLGPGAFREITGEVVNVALLGVTRDSPRASSSYWAIDCGRSTDYESKEAMLRLAEVVKISQGLIKKNPGHSIFLSEISKDSAFLGQYASSVQGLKTGDDERLVRFFWEIQSPQWLLMQSTVSTTKLFGGLERVVDWTNDGSLMARKQGIRAWHKHGIVVSQMSSLPCTLYLKGAFDSNVTVIFPHDDTNLASLLNFGFSGELSSGVRQFDQSIKPTNSSFEKIGFNLNAWTEVGQFSKKKPLPLPFSIEATQYVFHGHPGNTDDPLQVAVARLTGYRWPAEIDPGMELADEARSWIARCEKLAEHTDDDGIVCLPSVRQEHPADKRLLNLLIDAWETVQPGSWKPAVLDKLLADADCAGKGLDVWLRDKFFEQHVKRFQHRPFIWHVWDGLKDGFAALVNYHQLDAKKLERLIHTYLGDWIRQQETGVRDDVDGAQTRLAAAQDLKRRLELILEGEPPYDIFVRWKPLAEQPIGWNPDLNDGVRLNIRPFLIAEVLRHNKKPKLNISWDKDRGKDVASAPWFHLFKGDRINNHHLTLAQKKAAREVS